MRTVLLLCLVSGAALADDDAMRRCRAIGDGAQRLVCYDKMELGAAGPASAPPASAPMPATAPARQVQEQNFGIEAQAAKKQDEVRIEAVDSRIPGHFDGWVPRQRIRLANGQVWEINDGSEAVMSLDNPRVKVERGMLGAFYMDIDGARRAPKVRRLE